jgi:hypothetical protein
VKYGVNQNDGAGLDTLEYSENSLGAVHMHPKRARELIREQSEKALKSFAADRAKYPPFRLEPPYTIETWFRADTNHPPHKITRRHDFDIVAMYSAPAIREEI